MLKILVVDDEFVSRQKAVKILSDFGFCDVAMNGEEAVAAYMQAYDDGDPYQLITMDIMMPDMDGLEALKQIREFEKKRHIRFGLGVKVLMLTAKKTPKSVVSSFYEGCEAYVVKPFDKDRIIKALTELNYYETGV